jgi:hypothetical protein
MRRVLMVSYDFPPSSRGIWRTLKFCRYMGEFGWKPAILTVKPVRTERLDYGPLKELPEGTEVRRTESLDQNRIAFAVSNLLRRKTQTAAKASSARSNPRPTNAAARAVMDVLRSWVLIPDDRIGWYPFAVHAGRRWLRSENFDLVYTTCFPNTSHVVGERLAREAGLPYLADFRDIWIGNYYFYDPATRLHADMQRGMEERVVRTADRVVSVTEPITTDFLERYPDQPKEKFLTIPNGFDPGDFDFGAPAPDTKHFTITYAGTMYGSTSPRVFFRSVRRLLKESPEWRRVLRLRFVGSMIEPYRAMIERFSLGRITRIDNYMAHGEALRVMAEADALLLIVAPVEGSHIMLTQKVFEYAAAQRPILGLVPEGAARDFLNEIGEPYVAHPDDEVEIMRHLRSMLETWRAKGRVVHPLNPALARYDRRRLTEELCRTMDEIVEERNHH